MKKGLLLLFVLLSAVGLRAQVVADTLKADVTTVLENGKTYVLGKSGDMCKVSFTAPADGFLNVTTSQKINRTSLKINGATSTFANENGGFSKKGMAAGSLFEGTFYTFGEPSADNTYSLTVSFEEGVPYEAITLSEVYPKDGGEWSAAAYYWPNLTTSYQGQPYLKFSTAINTKTVVASVKIGEKVYSPIELYISSQNMTLQSLPDTLKAAVAEGLIKAGDTFQVILSGVEDKEFAANKLAEQTFTYTVASTACTGVTPAASTYRTTLPEEVVFSFDGTVKIDTAKFYFVNKFNGEKTELTGVTAEGTALTIPVPAIEGLLPKLYDIVAEGVTDENGKAITYGDTQGALTVSYGTSNGYFKPVVEPTNNSNPTSLKTYTMTLPGAAVYDATQAYDTIFFGKYNEATYGFEPYDDIQVSYEINENVITFTLSKEVTAPGDYRLSVPSKTFWAKDLYNAEKLSDATCYYMPSQNISTTILPYGPTSVTPEPGAMLNKLDKITLVFDQTVEFDDEAKVQVVMMKEDLDAWGWPTYSEDTIASVSISYDYENENNMIIDLGLIDSVGNYTIHIPEGAIWAAADESKKIGKWVYNYQVDPDYWDPEWVMETSGTSQGSPAQLIAGRKYSFSDMYAYMTYTATESGRLYFQILDDNTSADLTLCAEDWYNKGNFAKTEEGLYWVGVEAGQTVYMTDYGFGSRLYQLTFEAGSPYDALTYTGSFPLEGGQFSKSTEAPESWENGAVEFYFNTKVNKDEVKVYLALPSKNGKKIEITEDVSLYMGNIDYGKQPAYLSIVLADIIDDIKSENDLKAGDSIRVVLENVQDLNFASNALTEPLTLNLTLAATVCTSINPDPSRGVDGIPSELSLRFDGEVACANVKGAIIDVKSGNKQEFVLDSLATVMIETWSGVAYDATVTLPEAALELTSKKFAIELEGVVDVAGNAISYGDEVGKFVINYSMRDDNFNYVTADPENGNNVTSIKTTKLTFGEKVYLAPDAEEYASIWTDDAEIIGTLAIDPADEKSVIITWSEEITKAGAYYPNIPKGLIYDSKFDASKEDYGVADGAGYNPYISLEYYILADVSETTVASITPEPYGGWGSASLNSLPAEVVIEFNGNVKEVVNAYGERSMWSTRSTEVPEDAIPFEAKLVDNKVLVTIPAEVISEIAFGEFNITVNAIGEDGKAIGSAEDPYAENITFCYYVYKTLSLVESVPANGEAVKELNTIKLTFDAPIFEIDAAWEAPCLLNAETWEKVADLNYSFEGSEVTLTLAEPVTTEGEYIVYVPADIIYDESYTANQEINLYVTVGEVAPAELAIISATPENGATVENLTTVELKLNKEVGYLYKSMLIPSDGADDAHSAALTQSETDPTSYTLDFTILSENGAILRKDVTYTLTLEAWASEDAYNYNQGTPETVTLTYVGASEGFQYSGLKLESITPAEDFVISDKSQNKFVVKFNGPVELVESLTYINMGQGVTEKFESIVANDGQTEYTLTIAESVLAAIRGTVNIVLAANDLDGKRLQGNNGEGEYSTFAYYYTTTIGVPDLTITPDAAAEQATLTTITIGCAEGLVPSWTAGNITLTDANGKVVELNEPEAVVAEGADEWATPTAWTVALKEELTAIGTYTLTIPAGYFNIGSTQGQIMGNKKTEVVFNITQAAKDAAGLKGVTVDADVVVYNVAGVAVAQGKAADVLKNLGKGIYIVNGKKYVVK